MAQTAVDHDQRQEDHAAEQSMGSHGSFCWNELMTHDVQRAKKFYADTIGWTFDPMPMDWGTYWIIKAGDKMAGGIYEMQGPDFANAPENWLPYLAVDDVDARVKKAVAAGATIMRAPFDIPNVGRIAILRQPGGGAVGWMTPASPA
jgi:uncharacterized protein